MKHKIRVSRKRSGESILYLTPKHMGKLAVEIPPDQLSEYQDSILAELIYRTPEYRASYCDMLTVLIDKARVQDVSDSSV